MKTVTIRWTETSDHEARVQVPDDFDVQNWGRYDLENDLAELDEGFIGLQREVHEVSDVAELDEDATVFHPTSAA